MQKLLLIILDGWGHREESGHNAIYQAKKPVFDTLWSLCPNTLLEASGRWVGLPEGQIGSSEVGHMMIGAGRNIVQLSTTITQAIRQGSFFFNPVLLESIRGAKRRGRRVHLIGLTSDGGVHSYWEHLEALLTLARREGLSGRQVAVHAVLDGRDVGPRTGKNCLERLTQSINYIGAGAIATVMGRYWIMDRDKRWDRLAKAYRAITMGEGSKNSDPIATLGDLYAQGKTDEFIEPFMVNGTPAGPLFLENDDAVILYNFRADRMRQLARALSEPAFSEFDRLKCPRLHVVCMTQYDSSLDLPVAFRPAPADAPGTAPNLPQIIEERRWSQLHVAETEKYAHVTYFFNGGREAPWPAEERVMIPSPKVPTYDLTPEMSAREITDQLLARMGPHRFVVCNFANADMVGHTGKLDPAIQACEFVDGCLGRIMKKAEEHGWGAIITSDHGNSEVMMSDSGEPHTAHTTSRVPFVLWMGGKKKVSLLQDPNLALRNIAPTILEIMGLPKPSGMDATSLIA